MSALNAWGRPLLWCRVLTLVVYVIEIKGGLLQDGFMVLATVKNANDRYDFLLCSKRNNGTFLVMRYT